MTYASISPPSDRRTPSQLYYLEQEAISIMRDCVATAERPVMLYSIGKDSSVLLHLARKAFYPGKIPFPLLHIDTTWKFREMIAFRDRITAEIGFELRVHTHQEGLAEGLNPFDHGSHYTDIMKTAALKEALDEGAFDVAIGGARRDEDGSRSKERIVSFRGRGHRWDPKGQRPELWSLFNTQINNGESLRVFPLSDWTEADIWTYIEQEDIEIVPLYYAKPRPVVERDGMLIMVDDDRMPLGPDEKPKTLNVRFRTLGCYPLTGAVESNAETLQDIIAETLSATTSERVGRAIDKDSIASMERKKQDGYF